MTATATEPTTTTKWSYTTIVLTGGSTGRQHGSNPYGMAGAEELDRKEFEKHLNALGAEGFELFWVLREQKLHGEKDGHVLIFKRPVRHGDAEERVFPYSGDLPGIQHN
jgi:hypothetical protein